MKQYKSTIFILSLIVFIHSIFSISCISFIILHSLNKEYIFINILVFMVIISFLLYKRCVLIDLYMYINNLDYSDSLPAIAKDNYLRNKINSLIGNKEPEIDYTPFRLDILENDESMYKEKNKELHKNMYNHKIHYLLANIILIIIFLHKYNLTRLLPVLIIWITRIFPL